MIDANRQAIRRIATEGSPLVQGTAAATAAWLIARYALDHDQPFFAPVAAVIALNATLGERGLNAIRLLQGVVVGIVVGEVTLAAVGDTTTSLPLAVFVAMGIARALGGARITIAQAAVGAILTVAIGDPDAGIERLVDALVGVGVALVFSQLLFSPEPVGLLRRAEAAALADIGRGLEQTADALERDDDELGERAMTTLRALRDNLVELARTRRASTRVARRSAVWRSQRAPVVRENENAGYLDLLGASCLNLARAALAAEPAERRSLAPTVRELAGAVLALALDPGDRPTRQRAADRALEVARDTSDIAMPADPALAAVIAIRIAAGDVMMFAGVEPSQAVDAVEQGTGQFDVATPAPAPRTPFGRRDQP